MYERLHFAIRHFEDWIVAGAMCADITQGPGLLAQVPGLAGIAPPQEDLVVAGPATIRLKVKNTNTFFQDSSSVYATFQITDNQTQFSPSTAVVIPADATGPVNIVLESSPDLLNWTGALPGTYGSSATNRFFRVRAVRQ